MSHPIRPLALFALFTLSPAGCGFGSGSGSGSSVKADTASVSDDTSTEIPSVQEFRNLEPEQLYEQLMTGQAPPEFLRALDSILGELSEDELAYLGAAIELTEEGLPQDHLITDPNVQRMVLVSIAALEAEGVLVGSPASFAWSRDEQFAAVIVGLLVSLGSLVTLCVAGGWGGPPGCIAGVLIGALGAAKVSGAEVPELECSDSFWVDADSAPILVPRLGTWSATCSFTGTESCCSSCPISTSDTRSYNDLAVTPTLTSHQDYCAVGYTIEGPDRRDLLGCRASGGSMTCDSLEFGFEVHSASIQLGSTRSLQLAIQEESSRLWDGAGNSEAEIGSPCNIQEWDCSVTWTSYEL